MSAAKVSVQKENEDSSENDIGWFGKGISCRNKGVCWVGNGQELSQFRARSSELGLCSDIARVFHSAKCGYSMLRPGSPVSQQESALWPHFSHGAEESCWVFSGFSFLLGGTEQNWKLQSSIHHFYTFFFSLYFKEIETEFTVDAL